jgi:FtsP/CotA-like multicopper oxidase with cupredoxin domain
MCLEATVTDRPSPGRPTRRTVLTGGVGAVAAAALWSKAFSPDRAVVQQLTDAQLAASVPPDVHLAATDGWVSIADARTLAANELTALSPFWPDPLAYGHGDQATQDLSGTDPGAGLNLYVFGFRNVTDLTDAQVTEQRGQAQISAPLLAFNEGTNYRVKLSNLGLSQRPDLVDGHTIHWHGFVNEAPVFDGVPELSLSVPIGRNLTYFYKPQDAGTFMYHCHFEDVEHVQMGMTGLLFVRPKQNAGTTRLGDANPETSTKEFMGYAYNDLVPTTDARSTAYHREYSVFESEIFAEGHYRDAHIQVTDWTDFKASFWALNGRTYPDTLSDNAPFHVKRGYDPFQSGGRLQYQPQSALITAEAGERVLLRLASLGYQTHVMTADNIDFTVVGKDASLLRNQVSGPVGSTNPGDYVSNYLQTNELEVAPGESLDAIFTAPAFVGAGGAAYDSYLFYDRNYAYASNGGAAGTPGGMVTEIRIYPKGALGLQRHPNQTNPKVA